MTEELKESLHQRGIASTVIQRFVDDKIDCRVILLMDEHTLQTYLPAYGDRVAVHEMLEKITDVQKRDQFFAKFGDWLADRGINPYRMAVVDKGSMKEMVIKYHVFYRTSSQIAQFQDGMDDVCGMWGMVTKHASVFQPLFCNLPKPLMNQEMDRIIRCDFSELGSNARTSEDETVYAWELFLQDIEDGIAVVHFRSGQHSPLWLSKAD
ncbi:uncharacterized protein LOC127849345 isoform X2 [Dreissena polymorpha]|uniref:Uncharacterized protein n=2 Tax=Dreissena polymorpha TaxID=45954 RepID=A0A9D4DQZ6_DREPO|nr:uncharacterized protein LOC127849345 isoform X2 [Dreissena polymorpha]XP_052238038.1 uncharacterized protein LOC127849345 isoform X2 [Dreissena polymorpha]KAH3753628.1 hypothetical protein DPMN_188268 [Dreissena polymorpha]